MFQAIADLIIKNEDKYKHHRELVVEHISLNKEHVQIF